MKLIYPRPLQPGDTVMVVAPSSKSNYISEETHAIAKQRFAELGLNVVFSPNFDSDEQRGTPRSITERVAGLHAAFADPKIAGIFTVLGGYHCNQILESLDFEIIKNNPKVFCGFSDITALNNAILAQTGLVNFSGPHYSSFGMKHGFDFTLESFKRAVMSADDFDIEQSSEWSDDPWYRAQEDRTFIKNPGAKIMHAGAASGHLVGGNMSTISLLQGTKYMPIFDDVILFIEDDSTAEEAVFIRQLDSLLMQDLAKNIRGVLVGRFQNKQPVPYERIYQSISRVLPDVPVISGLDFGHTTPMLTIPVGGFCNMTTDTNNFKISRK
jgi:muramoyltetrapeptide carboxypeptidase LdcA involved in peptidoglycan recycling